MTAAVAASANDAPEGRRDGGIIAVVGFAHGVSHFFHLLLAPLFPWLMKDFSLSFTQIGVTMTLFFVVSGCGQALAGFAVDRWGARRVLFCGVGSLIAAGLVLAAAPGVWALFLSAALAGAGNAVFHPCDFTLLNRRVSPARLGHAFSIHGLSGNLGWAAAPAFMTGLATLAGWRIAALGAALLGVAVLVILFIWRRHLATPALSPEAAKAGQGDSPFAFLKVGAVWLCFGFFFFTTAAFGAFQNFGTPVLERVYGLSLALAASSLTAFLLGGAAGIGVGGFFAGGTVAHDRRIAALLVVAALLALVLASGWIPPMAVLPVMAAMGFCTGLAGPSRDLLVRRAAAARFGHQAYGRVYGFVYSGLDSGQALAPLLFGPFMDRGAFAGVLVGVALFQACAVFTALGVGRNQAKGG
ncbi:MFS transporter [Azospira inquinata]|uniref:MFS transporter n=1 Tax=Azospira inquinata TaxID=2785627 RepID=A0A975XUM0_9RHOO|nr:MFS transporter [Azospira inquinata]QWT45778.1 MFS transporter [Azospira inquinata]QWT48900.1 MFS transporter [Azospira inquinata]